MYRTDFICTSLWKEEGLTNYITVESKTKCLNITLAIIVSILKNSKGRCENYRNVIANNFLLIICMQDLANNMYDWAEENNGDHLIEEQIDIYKDRTY